MFADATNAEAAACMSASMTPVATVAICNADATTPIHTACFHLPPHNNALSIRAKYCSAGCTTPLALTLLVSMLLMLCPHAGELVMVLHWSLINYSAIVKILKKHDKRSGVLLRAPYLANVLTQVGALGQAGRGVGLGRPGKGQCRMW